MLESLRNLTSSGSTYSFLPPLSMRMISTMRSRGSEHEVLALPPEHRVTWVLALGYPAESDANRQNRTRVPLDEFVFSERWGESR